MTDQEALQEIVKYHADRLAAAAERRAANATRHVGLELKFPVVAQDGTAAGRETLDTFWAVCMEDGWAAVRDEHSGRINGMTTPDTDNPDLISTTTGECVLEFSVAHCADLFELQRNIAAQAELAAELTRRTGARLLGLGIQPVTCAQQNLRTKKGRHLFWDSVLPPRADTPHEHDGAVDLFTIIADSQVHIDIAPHEAVDAVNALNALAAPQLALTANSSVWNGQADLRHVAVRELFWDWWLGEAARHGMPPRPFADFTDYVRATAELTPIYVTREGRYLGLSRHSTFLEYYGDPQPVGTDADGRETPVTPAPQDIDLHDRAFWWNARLARFGTIESRVSCQQPPEELLGPAALALGVVENLGAALELVRRWAWDDLRELRVQAAHVGLEARVARGPVRPLVEDMLAVAEAGLARRGRGEEAFLGPLRERAARLGEPALTARRCFQEDGVRGLLERFGWG